MCLLLTRNKFVYVNMYKNVQDFPIYGEIYIINGNSTFLSVNKIIRNKKNIET